MKTIVAIFLACIFSSCASTRLTYVSAPQKNEVNDSRRNTWLPDEPIKLIIPETGTYLITATMKFHGDVLPGENVFYRIHNSTMNTSLIHGTIGSTAPTVTGLKSSGSITTIQYLEKGTTLFLQGQVHTEGKPSTGTFSFGTDSYGSSVLNAVRISE